VNQKQTARINLGDDGEDEEHDDSPIDESKCMTLLDKSEIHVLTKSKEPVIPNKSIRVVICSYGLAPALVERGSLYPGLFKCAIVDESHMLKNMATKRTKLLVPVLHATQRCVLLSGTPALARPCELWPQLKILGTEKQGWWEDEDEFVNNYVKKSSPARRAELHAMLTGTVMIRRMKTDILKSLPKKVREKAVVDVSTKELRKKFHQYMELLREGKGVLGKLARQHSALVPDAADVEYGQEYATAVPEEKSLDMQKHQESVRKEAKQRYLEGKNRIHHTLMTTSHQLDENQKNDLVFRLDADLKTEIKVWADEQMVGLKEKQAKLEEGPTRQSVLNLMYSLTAKAKIPLLVDMIKKWLADPAKGKLCVFAHHRFMLDAIVNDVGLSNAPDSKSKYIRIDGSTQPMDRQTQIKAFQNDPSVRIAVLGITAAGVAVTLTASSTVWFTELFWTPALMIQAEGKLDVVALVTQGIILPFLTLWMFSFLRSLSPNWAKLSSTVPLFRCTRYAGRAFVENARGQVPGSRGIRRRKRETKADSTSSLQRY
jgi:SNF2 family DNA or RNA helicase